MPAKYTKTPTPDTEHFWRRVDTSADCSLWTGPVNRGGYGVYNHLGERCLAHRAAWILTFGPIPDGMGVLHHCDNPPCVRPDHLFIGTQADNARDMNAKGRNVFQKHPEKMPRGDRHHARKHPEKMPRGDDHPARVHPERMARGERCGTAKLTESDIRTIRRLHAEGIGYVRLARQFGVHKTNIASIVTGKTWRHVK